MGLLMLYMKIIIIILRNQEMEADLFISMLGPLSPEAIEDIDKLQIESECIFTLQPNCQDEDQFIQSEVHYNFQIREDFLVECQSKSKKIVGGIPITLDYKFEIKRFTYDPSAELGKPYAFILYLPQKEDQDQQVAIKLGVSLECGDMLQNFAECLQSKLIFQFDIQNNYKVMERLFWSNSAALYSAIRLRDGYEVVIKCMRKELFKQIGRDLKKGIEREYGIPRKIKSSYVCKYYGVFENDTSIYIVMEKLHINFLQYLRINGLKSQQKSKEIFQKICSAIDELHQQGIMHRDIKPQNIMLRKISEDIYQPVLIDFGLAQYDGKHPYIFVRCGTPGYVAPQIAQSNQKQPNYNRSCDIFSLGSLFHLILLHKPLFEANNFGELIEKNQKCEINLEDQKYENLSKKAKDLLSKMLEKDPTKRITAKQILTHQYFQQKIFQVHKTETTQITQNQTGYRQETG